MHIEYIMLFASTSLLDLILTTYCVIDVTLCPQTEELHRLRALSFSRFSLWFFHAVIEFNKRLNSYATNCNCAGIHIHESITYLNSKPYEPH